MQRQNNCKIWKDTNFPYNPKTFTFYPGVLRFSRLDAGEQTEGGPGGFSIGLYRLLPQKCFYSTNQKVAAGKLSIQMGHGVQSKAYELAFSEL